MPARHKLQTLARGIALIVAEAVLIGVALLAFSGCATSKPESNEIIITDSTTRKQVQRLVAVAVPGDSAKLRTRIRYDEATGRFQPVTIYSHSAHGLLTFSLDAYGLVTASTTTAPWLAQVPVTDTEVTHTHSSQERQVVAVKAPLSRFVKFCIGFTIVAFLLLAGVVYLKFFTPFRFIK
jgi:hypothetical protein